jgi:hypothetical protein
VAAEKIPTAFCGCWAKGPHLLNQVTIQITSVQRKKMDASSPSKHLTNEQAYQRQINLMHQALEQQKAIQMQLLARLRDTMALSPALTQIGSLPSSPSSLTGPEYVRQRSDSTMLSTSLQNVHLYSPVPTSTMTFGFAPGMMPSLPMISDKHESFPTYFGTEMRQSPQPRDRSVSEPFYQPARHERTLTSGTAVDWSVAGRTSSFQSDLTYRTDMPEERQRSFSDQSIPPKSSRGKEKSFSCQICGSVFSCSGGLSRHRRIHTNRRSYACSVMGCDRTFNRVDNCKTHEMAHRKRLGMDPTPTPIITKNKLRADSAESEDEVLEVEVGSVLD